MSLRASGSNLISKLSKGDSSILVRVHLFNDFVNLILRDVEPSALDDSLEFISGDGTVGIQIEGVEGIVDVEVWVAAELLADSFSCALRSEVSSPAGFEILIGWIAEAVVASVDRVPVVGSASAHVCGVIVVESEEGSLKFAACDSAVSVCVVSLDPEVDFVLCWEETNGVEAILKIVGVDRSVASASLVEDLKCIDQVKVWVASETGLVSFNITLDFDDVTEAIHELVLIPHAENWATSWR